MPADPDRQPAQAPADGAASVFDHSLSRTLTRRRRSATRADGVAHSDELSGGGSASSGGSPDSVSSS